jgi:hypothetical protein
MNATSKVAESKPWGLDQDRSKAIQWTAREGFCSDLVDLLKRRIATTDADLTQNAGGTFGQLEPFSFGNGHGSPCKGRVIPLVPAGKARARGSEQISEDCCQPELLSTLPTSLIERESSADLELSRESAAFSSSSNSEGRIERRDRKQPMVTSAPILGFLSQG